MKSAINVHPGMLLRDEVEYRRLDKRELAKQLEIPYKDLKSIFDEKQPITADIAMRIEALLGLPAYVFIERQKKYDIRALEESKKHVNLLSRLRALRKSVAL
jgi:addiction module HigA family antidote